MVANTTFMQALPDDWRDACLIGRFLRAQGPTPVMIYAGLIYDMTPVAATVAQLMRQWPKGKEGGRLMGRFEDFADTKAQILSPIDLHCVKAAGVTFAVSAVERVIEERARGDATKATDIREALKDRVGADIRSVVPGSEAAARLKDALIQDGLWSQYLEVAIGPDAEIFTKAPVLSTIGWGDEIGIRSDSTWNNPEPEVVLVADHHGRALGATLGNDVNLRCFEGRSALLLGKAKDNNASCALGPFIRLFDQNFTLDDVRTARLDLRIEGPEGYVLEGHSLMREISRDPLELLRQALSEHQYPDGFVLMLGTLFAPTQDRDIPGRGFTHKVGDVVSIASPRLGALVNRVVTSGDAAPWTFGITDLMQNLARRGLLNEAAPSCDVIHF